MCTNCVTALDATVMQSAFAAAVLGSGYRRVRGRFRSRVERDAEVYAANASFVASLGLDPVEVLGAPRAPDRELVDF